MSIFLVILHVICCFTLILVILLQAGRGQGLTGPSFASGNVQSLFGTRAGDFLTKATSVAAICFLLTCITLDYIEAQKSRSLLEGPRRQKPSQIDVQKIKEALEKIKKEVPPATAQKQGAAVGEAGQQAANAVQAAAGAEQKVAGTVATETAAAKPEVAGQAASTAEPPQPVNPNAPENS